MDVNLTEKPSALKREHPALQNMKFLFVWASFSLLDADPLTWLNPDLIRIRIRITYLGRLLRKYGDPGASLTSPLSPVPYHKIFPFILIIYEKSLAYEYFVYFRFGSVMLENLMSRGCLLSGVRACRDKAGDRNTSVHRMAHLKGLGRIVWL